MFNRNQENTGGQDLIPLLDVTSLNGNDTDASVDALLGRVASCPVAPAAVCVFPVFIALAKKRLNRSTIKVATVAGGFPHGLSPMRARVDEIAWSVAMGTDEIDVVIRRSLALEGEWKALEEEVAAFRAAAGSKCLKVILEVSELRDSRLIARAAETCIAAGADFIKTSTGKAAEPATLEHGKVVLDVIARAGRPVGFKAAGGIRTAPQAGAWLSLAEDALGKTPGPSRFRIGASGLFDLLAKSLGG
jgi:deoxyribose-phosphate aldolase